MSRALAMIACVVLLILSYPCFGSLSPRNVAVIVSEGNNASEAVGRYYCEKAGTPISNLIAVQAFTREEISDDEFCMLAQRIREKLVTQLGVDPDDCANDPIQVLVLCYGIPTKIVGSRTDSVDSYLTLLFNRDPDLGPSVQTLLIPSSPAAAFVERQRTMVRARKCIGKGKESVSVTA